MNPFYLTIRTIFIPLLRLYNRMEVDGLESVPREGACILAANHASYLDAFVLGAACPRKVHFMVVRDQFEKWFARWFYWGMDAFPVNQDGWDGEAVKEALRRLARGEVIGIYPEGSRSFDGTIGEMKAGVALLARRSGAPVVPVSIVGSGAAFRRGSAIPLPRKIRVRFGEPLRLPGGSAGRGDREAMNAFLSELRERIARPLSGPVEPPRPLRSASDPSAAPPPSA